jgi:hypothetical protein
MSKKTENCRPVAAGKKLREATSGIGPSDAVRARDPINRSTGLVRGKFPSLKTGRTVHWESQLERDAVLLFEFSTGVKTYREQPITTYYALDGKTRRYTPDFEITLVSGQVILIEIKPEERLNSADERHRFNRITEHFAEQGRLFVVFTERDIRHPILLENLRLLFRHRCTPWSAFERRRFRRTAQCRTRIFVRPSRRPFRR